MHIQHSIYLEIVCMSNYEYVRMCVIMYIYIYISVCVYPSVHIRMYMYIYIYVDIGNVCVMYGLL